MKVWVCIALGSALGGVGRYALSSWMAQRFEGGFPWGTLTVNVVGSFLIGLIYYLTVPDGKWELDPAWRQGLMIGFCGGFTTFSTFSFQVLGQLQEGDWLGAAANILLSVLVMSVGSGYRGGSRPVFFQLDL